MTTQSRNQDLPLFSLGQTVATQGAISALRELNLPASLLLVRHHAGDWGDLSNNDKLANDDAVINNGQIFSAYQFNDLRLWVITEADRSRTTILLPEEY